MMKCVIVDDEPLAREGLASYVREIDSLELVTTCQNPVELKQVLDAQPIDVIFLDIQMPKMNGIDFLKMVQQLPMVIITTAYPSYALEGFQLNVLDYLLKPITFDRFFQAVNKAQDYHALRSRPAQPAPAPDYFFIRNGSRYEKVLFADILFIEGSQNYVTIYTVKGKAMTLLYLKHLEQSLDSSAFIRVHKSYIVSIPHIESIEGNEICIREHRIPISRNYRDSVVEKVVMNKLWDKIKFS